MERVTAGVDQPRSRSEDRGVTGTGWQCLATAGISAEGKELSAKR